VNDTHHATGIVLGDAGVLIRGPSGAGKSLLALDLIERWTARGRTALLVADDRVAVSEDAGVLVMTAPPTIAGRIELRGRGIIAVPFRARAPLHLVVDLTETLDRMPEAAEFATVLLGLTVARSPVPKRGVIDSAHQMLLVEAGVAELAAAGLPQEQKSA
jgi:serine kinase of HPr protein (carbohydrate metabolism regulator)